MALFYTTECWRLQRVCADFSRYRSVAVLSSTERGISLVFQHITVTSAWGQAERCVRRRENIEMGSAGGQAQNSIPSDHQGLVVVTFFQVQHRQSFLQQDSFIQGRKWDSTWDYFIHCRICVWHLHQVPPLNLASSQQMYRNRRGCICLTGISFSLSCKSETAGSFTSKHVNTGSVY